MQRRKAKIVAVASTSVLILVGATFYTIDKNKLIMDPINIVETNDLDTILEEESNSIKLSTPIDVTKTTEKEVPTNYINTDVSKVIEVDEETGIQTIENTDGDVVVINDDALAEAEANAEVDDLSKDPVYLEENLDNDDGKSEEVIVNKEEIDKAPKTEDAKGNNKVEKVEADKSQVVTGNYNNMTDEEIDEKIEQWFEEMGWPMDASEHQSDTPEDAVWTFQEYDGPNPFYTP